MLDPRSETETSQDERTSSQERQSPAALTALSVRLFAYGGPQGKLRSLGWQPESTITGMLRGLVQEGQGRVTEIGESALLAHFENPLHALVTARALQQKLLTFRQDTSPEQVVAAAIVHGWSNPGANAATEDTPTEIFAPPTVLAEPGPAQVLVTQKIYDIARSLSGFEFNDLPVRGPGETGTAESFYELLWADASTYAHLRQAIHDAGANTPRQTRYEIQAELGRGAMGLVYKAYDRMIGRTVALKTIAVDGSGSDHESLVERLKQEAKAAGCLDHPNIITIFDVGQEDNLVYLSMQFVEGVTLSSLLADGKLPPLSTLLAYADQICSAVGYAHRKGVIHRDLKPANLMLTPQGQIKVLDFGIAKLGDTGLTQAGMVIGTPTYMAPEQAVGKKIDHRSDIYALGAVFYELVTRERPFKGEITTIFYKLINEDPTPPSLINPSLPIGIDAIIRKALAKDPNQRFQSCEEMRQALAEQAALLGGTGAAPTLVSRPVAAERPQASVAPARAPDTTVARRKSRGWIYAGLTICILAAAVVLALRVARVKAAISAFKDPQATTQPDATKGSATVAQPPASADGNTSPATGVPATSQPSATAGATGPGGSGPGNTQPGSGTATPSTGDVNAGQPSSSSVSSTTDNAKPKPVTQTTVADPATKNSSDPKNAADTASDTGTGDTVKAPRRPRTLNQDAATPGVVGVSVEGFHRSDVPDLLKSADGAAARGDYVSARYGYGIVLRLEPRNPRARAGVQRVIQAERERQ